MWLRFPLLCLKLAPMMSSGAAPSDLMTPEDFREFPEDLGAGPGVVEAGRAPACSSCSVIVPSVTRARSAVSTLSPIEQA